MLSPEIYPPNKVKEAVVRLWERFDRFCEAPQDNDGFLGYFMLESHYHNDVRQAFIESLGYEYRDDSNVIYRSNGIAITVEYQTDTVQFVGAEGFVTEQDVPFALTYRAVTEDLETS